MSLGNKRLTPISQTRKVHHGVWSTLYVVWTVKKNCLHIEGLQNDMFKSLLQNCSKAFTSRASHSLVLAVNVAGKHCQQVTINGQVVYFQTFFLTLFFSQGSTITAKAIANMNKQHLLLGVLHSVCSILKKTLKVWQFQSTPRHLVAAI